MSDLSKIKEVGMQRIGEKVLNEININLYNTEPTIHKAYHIYVELVHAGYKEKNKELACVKIKNFFRTRTVRNQRKEFKAFFGIPFSDEMRPILALSFITSEIDPIFPLSYDLALPIRNGNPELPIRPISAASGAPGRE